MLSPPSQRNQTTPYHTSRPLQKPAWARRALQSRRCLSDNTNTMKNVVWGVATHSWGKAKLHISAAAVLPRAGKSLCGSMAAATSGERPGCPTCQGHGRPVLCCCLQSTVCFQMLLALRQEVSQPFHERKQGLWSLCFLPGISTARADGICLGLISMDYDALGSAPSIDFFSQLYLQKHLRPHSYLICKSRLEVLLILKY